MRRGIFRLFLSVMALTLSLTQAQAQRADVLSNDDKELQDRVLEAQSRQIQALDVNSPPKINLQQLKDFWSLQERNQPGCQDTRKVLFAEKFVLTYDKDNQPCRIYDLSFPNLRALVSNKSLLQVPVRKLTSRDFLDALDQNWGAIQERNRQYAQNFNSRNEAMNSFIARLKFKRTLQYVPGSQVQGRGLPVSFNLGDVQLQSQFKLSQSVQDDFKRLLQRMEGTAGSTDLYRELANNPDTLLKAVRFEWNDLEKVYNVILDGRFLPLMGPVEVMNFQQPYRAPVEKMTRQLLGNVLNQLARFIPDPTAQAVVEMVVDDVFEQIELMYSYQSIRLEQVLSTLSANQMRAEDYRVLTSRGLNLLYGQKSDLMSSYIMAALQGQEFDWQGLEKQGPANRYAALKQRKVMMSQMHSRLVLETQCQTSIMADYFASCTRGSVNQGIYSLISEQKIPFKSFGAPLVFNAKNPSAITFIRGGLWILSAGLRVVGLPIARQVTYYLDSYIKGYMHSGILDEAFLQSYLLQQSQAGQLPADSKIVLDWLYIQNLNPFLPKSVKSETRFVDANKQLMGKIED